MYSILRDKVLDPLLSGRCRPGRAILTSRNFPRCRISSPRGRCRLHAAERGDLRRDDARADADDAVSERLGNTPDAGRCRGCRK